MGTARSRVLAALLALIVGLGATAASATVVQDGLVRIFFLTHVSPYKLPRDKPAPISVSITGHVAAVDGGIPPQLKRMDIKVNRHGLLQSRDLPVCPAEKIFTATTQKALRLCKSALIGSGRFWAHIVLPEQGAYPTQGRLLIFNGREGGKKLVLAHIFTSSPFPSSFVISFAIHRIHDRLYGTELSAALPQALGDWGYVDRIKLNLKRKYRVDGRQLSYFNASCPAPHGTNSASYPLAVSSFHFAGQKVLEGTVVKACGVRR